MNKKYYIISNQFGLRGYTDKPYCVIKRQSEKAIFVSKKQYDLLLKCDGKTPLELDDMSFISIKAFVEECELGQKKLEDWQKEVKYSNRYMPNMNIQLTGKCNYNCLHCFNAVDNAPLNTEITYDEAISILDQAKDCGVLGFTITGGEPMIHSRFIDIMEEIYKRDMIVFDLNTNGYFINEEILNKMKSFNMNPMIKISFDGIGFHDWMRNFKGAETKAIEAMKLCVKAGFKTAAQVNVNKKNYESMKETMELLNTIGLYWVRIISTIEVPRWANNVGDACYTHEEYFDLVIELSKYYIEKEFDYDITFWHAVDISSKNKTFDFPKVYNETTYDERLPLCKGAYEMMAIGSNGNVYPCLQVQGVFESSGFTIGNIKKQKLIDLLNNSDYQKYMKMCIRDKIEYNSECRDCEYLKKCGGGCPCLSLLYSKHRYNKEVMKCVFFKKEYDRKIIETIKGYKNITNNPYGCN